MAVPAALIVIWIALIDVNDTVDVFVIILSFVLIITLAMRAVRCTTKRTKRRAAHLEETHSSEEEMHFASEDE